MDAGEEPDLDGDGGDCGPGLADGVVDGVGVDDWTPGTGWMSFQ